MPLPPPMPPGESLLLQTRIKFPPMPLREILQPRPRMGYLPPPPMPPRESLPPPPPTPPLPRIELLPPLMPQLMQPRMSYLPLSRG